MHVLPDESFSNQIQIDEISDLPSLTSPVQRRVPELILDISQGVPLKADSTSFENWEKQEGDLFIEYYLFNITNEGNGEKPPEMTEIGPYTYRYMCNIFVRHASIFLSFY